MNTQENQAPVTVNYSDILRWQDKLYQANADIQTLIEANQDNRVLVMCLESIASRIGSIPDEWSNF